MLGIRNEQDANLIAAAPDLFDKESQAYAKTVINQLRAALTKDKRWGK